MAGTTNGQYWSTRARPILGMIDANAYHGSRVTWPLELSYVKSDGETKSLKEIVAERYHYFSLGEHTAEMGNHLVDINTEIYNQNNRARCDQNRKDVPSLIIASTVDMEFAHLNGYDGEAISCGDESVFLCWDDQITAAEIVAASNPLRYFPLLSYDPRRYRYTDKPFREPMLADCGRWNDPFAHIVGCEDSVDGIDKIWLGFCMNPSLGFRPLDEYCKHLPDFYKKCQDSGIPILAHCAAEGFIAHAAQSYKEFDNTNKTERRKKSEERHNMMKWPDNQDELDSHGRNRYQGRESVDVNDPDIDYFYMNYGHPRNWIPVLKHWPEFRLCLAGFGGNREWLHMTMQTWAAEIENNQLPDRDWVKYTIKLTRWYKNVYIDISGLNIYDPLIRLTLLKMLYLIQSGQEDFKHLRYKLMFGYGWYLTHMIDMDNNDYGKYYNEFKALFNYVDNTGKLWELVSFINPWCFYRLSDEKINKVYDELVNITDDCNTLENMRNILADIEKDERFVKYISGRNIEINKLTDLGLFTQDEFNTLKQFIDNNATKVREFIRKNNTRPNYGIGPKDMYDCSTTVHYGLQKLLSCEIHTKIRQIDKIMIEFIKSGYAEKGTEVRFKDKKENQTIGMTDPDDYLNLSLSETVEDIVGPIKEDGYYVFGVSLKDGYHSLILIAKAVIGKKLTFNIFDQGGSWVKQKVDDNWYTANEINDRLIRSIKDVPIYQGKTRGNITTKIYRIRRKDR